MLLDDVVLPKDGSLEHFVFLLEFLNSFIEVVMHVPVHSIHEFLAADGETSCRDCLILIFTSQGEVSEHHRAAVAS